MKLSVSLLTTSLLLASCSSAAVLDRRQDETNLGDIVNSVTSRVGSVTSEVGSAPTQIVDEVSSRVEDLTSNVGAIPTNIASEVDDIVSDINTAVDDVTSKVASGWKTLTDYDITIPAFPTASIDSSAVSDFVGDIRTKLEPEWISSLRDGETPAAVSSIIDAVPTNYEDSVRAEISQQLVDGASDVGNNNDGGSKAPALGDGLTYGLVSVAAGIVGLAVAL